MKIVYLGTAAAEGIPAVFCNCETCRAARLHGGRAIRTRAQVLIDGELSIDFSPDAFYHSALLGADLSAVKYLFVTHSHFDHIFPQELCMRGYVYAHGMTSPSLSVYANGEVTGLIREFTRREMREDVAAGISFHVLHPYEETAAGDYTVVTLPAKHNTEEPLLFCFEKGGKRVLHLCDTGFPSSEALDFLKEHAGRCDLITLDCTHLFSPTRPSGRHMGLADNARLLEELEKRGLADGNTKRVVTHFSHNSAPTEELLLRAEREYGVIAAYDGLTVEI